MKILYTSLRYNSRWRRYLPSFERAQARGA